MARSKNPAPWRYLDHFKAEAIALRQQLDETESIIADLEEAGGWTPVRLGLPLAEFAERKDCIMTQDCLVVIQAEDGPSVVAYQYSTYDGWCYYDGQPSPYAEDVSHWRPFPNPPLP